MIEWMLKFGPHITDILSGSQDLHLIMQHSLVENFFMVGNTDPGNT